MKTGSTVSLTCLAYSNSEDNSVSYEWLFPPELEEEVTTEDDVLTVDGIESEANFTCVLSQERTGLSTSASSTVFLGEVMEHTSTY